VIDSLQRYFRVFFFVLLGGAFAFVGETGGDNGLIKSVWVDLWTAAKTASPLAAMVLLLLLIDERKDRKEAQKQCNERTISFVEATNSQSNAIEQITDLTKAIATEIRRRERKGGTK
jgi:hypothetical protein